MTFKVMNHQLKRKLFWITFGLFSIIIRGIVGQYPEIVEKYYSRTIFLGIRWTIDTFFGWLPFAWIYLFFLGLMLWLVRKSIRLYHNPLSWQVKVGRGVLSILAFLFGGVGLFLWIWGFNYSRIAVEDQLSLDPVPLGLSELKEELDIETEKLIRARRVFNEESSDSIALSSLDLPDDYELRVRKVVKLFLVDNNFPTIGKVRGRELYPKGIFLRFSSSGLYFPFTGEGHVDAGIHPLQKPFIIAHEMFHGYGFGDEGTCNFNAYLSCIQSDDPFIAYAGHLAYWRTLAINYLRYRPEEYRTFRRDLPLPIQADLDAINEVLMSYPDIMPRFRYYAYDTYLKVQGIDEGMKNYNRVIMLVHAWRKQKRT